MTQKQTHSLGWYLQNESGEDKEIIVPYIWSRQPKYDLLETITEDEYEDIKYWAWPEAKREWDRSLEPEWDVSLDG